MTAEEFLCKNYDPEYYKGEVFGEFAFPKTIVESAMIGFAKCKVEEALAAAENKAMVDNDSIRFSYDINSIK